MNYIITSHASGIAFKVSYKRGVLYKIEHTAGKLEKDSWINLVKLILNIPEKEINAHIAIYSALSIEKVTKATKSLFKAMMDAYFNFYEAKFELKPRVNATSGKALKDIIAFLQAQTGTEEATLATWEYIFQNWNTLPEFYQNQADLKQINGNLNTLLRLLKNEQLNQERDDDLRNASE